MINSIICEETRLTTHTPRRSRSRVAVPYQQARTLYTSHAPSVICRKPVSSALQTSQRNSSWQYASLALAWPEGAAIQQHTQQRFCKPAVKHGNPPTSADHNAVPMQQHARITCQEKTPNAPSLKNHNKKNSTVPKPARFTCVCAHLCSFTTPAPLFTPRSLTAVAR
jgi:hypothetical protein